MKLKTVFAASLLVGSVAFADSTEVTAEYVLGVMPLTVGKETIISIPWVESGTTDDSQTIAVTNIIKTANLAVGDYLLWYTNNNNNGTYEAWSVKEGTPNYWAPVTVASIGRVVPSPGAADQALSRGGALILRRGSSISTNIYIVGQYSAGNGSSTIAEGTVDEPVFSLLSSPAVSGPYDLSTKLVAGDNGDNYEPVLNDQVVFENTSGHVVTYTWRKIPNTGNLGWGRSVWSEEDGDIVIEAASADSMKISAGKGFWYKRCGDEATINW